MAFNPFSSFRKHKKGIFAGLVLVCMVTFILSFGRGDFFEWVGSLFGGKGQRGPLITTLNGKEVREQDIRQGRYQRAVAHTFLRENFLREYREAESEEKSLQGQMRGPENQENFQRFFQAFQRKTRFERLHGLAASYGQRKSGHYQEQLDFMMWLAIADQLHIRLTDEMARNVINSFSPDRPFLTGKTVTDEQALRQTEGRSDGRGSANLKTLYQALGDEIRVATAQGIVLGVPTDQLYYFREDNKIKPDGLFVSRGHGFRLPFDMTPGEYMVGYREALEKSDALLMPIPVDAFLASVPDPGTDSKTKEELQKIYRDFRSKEPAPNSATPGFKQPDRIRVQYVVNRFNNPEDFRKAARLAPLAGYLADYSDTDPRTPYFKECAQRGIGLSLLAYGAPDPFGILASQAALVGITGAQVGEFGNPDNYLGWDPRAFAVAQYKMQDVKLPSLLTADPAQTVYQTATTTVVAASLVGNSALGDGLVVATASQLVPAAIFQPRDNDAKSQLDWLFPTSRLDEVHKVVADLRAERSRVVAALMLASPSTPLANLAPWYWADYSDVMPFDLGPTGEEPSEKKLKHVLTRHVPAAAMRAILDQYIIKRLGAQVEALDFHAFEKKLADAKGDEKKFKEALDEGVKKMRLQTVLHQSANDDDRHNIAKDPGLWLLRQWYLQQHNGLERQADAALTNLIFGSQQRGKDHAVFKVERQDTSSTPSASWAIGDTENKSSVLLWRTKFEPAREVPFEEVEKDVVRAWKMKPAREKARKAAEALRARLNGKKPEEIREILASEAKQNPAWGELIHWDNVSRKRMQEEAPNPNSQTTKTKKVVYHNFDFAKVPYPSREFLEELLKIGVAKADILEDEPKRHYYVAAILGRTLDDSLQVALAEENRKAVEQELEEEKQRLRREAILLELRRNAAKGRELDARGRFILEPGISDDEREK